MNKYLTLANTAYRVEICWNVYCEYCEMKKVKDLSKLDSLSNLSPLDLRDFIYCAIKEGERLDGKELLLTAIELGSILRPADICTFVDIFKEQIAVEGNNKAGKKEVEAKKKRRFF